MKEIIAYEMIFDKSIEYQNNIICIPFQEIIVLPKFQRKGIGTMIVNHLIDYAKANSITGKFTTIGGVSAKGKELFYKNMGFDIISNGIKKMIEIE